MRCEDFALKKTKECAQGGVGRDRSISRKSQVRQGQRIRGHGNGETKNAVETTTAKKKREKCD